MLIVPKIEKMHLAAFGLIDIPNLYTDKLMAQASGVPCSSVEWSRKRGPPLAFCAHTVLLSTCA